MNQNQKRCLDFIKGYIASNGYSPSYQEMADYLGFASKSAIFTIIKNLKNEGYIKVAKRGQRNIKLAECENCEILQKQLDIAIRCLEKYADQKKEYWVSSKDVIDLEILPLTIFNIKPVEDWTKSLIKVENDNAR